MNKLSSYIDHTILKADAKKEEIIELCKQAKEYEFASVCINASWVNECWKLLKDTPVKVCTVVGFPLGATSSASKAFEAKKAIEDGASEIDMVINIGLLKDKNYTCVLNDIKEVRKACEGKLLKVIIETCLLNEDEKVKACELAKEAKADFVKTSTGFSTGGATKEDIALMRKVVGEEMGVKASGGVRTKEDALVMIKAGASRIGASSSIRIVNG